MGRLTLSLVRHGATVHTERGAYSGWNDLALSERGRDEAMALGQQLADSSFDSTITSDLRRCVETAALAGYPATTDARWRELDFGTMDGLTFDDLDAATQSDLIAFDTFVAPGGESTTSLLRRLLQAIGDLADGHHLVFTHGGPIHALLRHTRTHADVSAGSVVTLDSDALRELPPTLAP